ncbi:MULTISPECIES: HalOD1 output domain-containing protein [Haloarcula]|uniref:HalOD1 output domain-containing protein n=1 Tax=Haloarcula TaxID=2237 RepID=UPI0023ECC462|nr:HalOD1 output domain-containing protein [Halomicroarcula sp. XH51]
MDELSDRETGLEAIAEGGMFSFATLTTDEATGTTTAEFDPADGVPSMAVTALVADRKGVDPCDLPVVYDVIDPDALDMLFGDHRAGLANASVSFRYEGFDVRIDHGTISITGRA